MSTLRRRVGGIVLAGALAGAVLVPPVGAAKAGQAMEEVCVNPAGNEPNGKCQGQALREEVRNPAGKLPPGQQP